MGVTILHHRHPAAESGAGTTPRISPGATMTRGRLSPQVPLAGPTLGSSLCRLLARPAALRFLRLAVSRSHPQFAPLAAECAGRGPGVGDPVLPPGFTEKTKGPPRFLENPRERALFSDPGGIAGARPLRRCDTAFR